MRQWVSVRVAGPLGARLRHERLFSASFIPLLVKKVSSEVLILTSDRNRTKIKVGLWPLSPRFVSAGMKSSPAVAGGMRKAHKEA
jgi:hypothetical protein